MRLKERGLYRLRDGREFIACATGDGRGYFLYTPEEWNRSGLADYRVDASGRIFNKGRLTHWRVEDLKEIVQSGINYRPAG